MASMVKVLLCEDIDKLGWLGDIVEVKSGYARNYLLPCGLAQVATDANIKSIADEKARHANDRKSARLRLDESVEKVGGAEAVVAAKANEQGHLFGSIGAAEIAGNLREQGFEVPDDAVQLASHIKEVGTHSVTLKFAEDVSCEISVVVVAEQSEGGDESGDGDATEAAKG